MKLRDLPDRFNEISGTILDAGIEVHRTLGRWYMESVYRDCLAHELRTRGLHVDVEEPLTLSYKTLIVPRAFRVDLFVERCIIVELKTVPKLLDEHEAQLLTYMNASGCQLGIVLNFQAPLLKDGFIRKALSPSPTPSA